MSVFVLVHGSWAGGWQWAKVRRILEREGHRVIAPTLTGMADRFHLATESTGLLTHIEDIARLIEWEREENVILAGHSYGGMVITGVAARVADRIAHLVYVDAFLPRPGECAWDLLPWQREAFQGLRLPDRPWLVRPVDIEAQFPELANEGLDRLTPMPVRTHEEPLPSPRAPEIPGTYIHCTAAPSFFDEVAERAVNDRLEKVSLDAGHAAILTHPAEIAGILLAVARKGTADGISPIDTVP